MHPPDFSIGKMEHTNGFHDLDFSLSGEVGEVFQPPAVLQVQSGLRGAQHRAGGLPSPGALVPHCQLEERGHRGEAGSPLVNKSHSR